MNDFATKDKTVDVKSGTFSYNPLYVEKGTSKNVSFVPPTGIGWNDLTFQVSDSAKASAQAQGGNILRVTGSDVTTTGGVNVLAKRGTDTVGYLTVIVFDWGGGIQFKKGAQTVTSLSPHNCPEAYCDAVVGLTPSGLSLTYSILSDASHESHGSTIGASTGRITNDGLNDTGTITVRVALTAANEFYTEGELLIRAKPVEISSTNLQNPYALFQFGYGLCKKHTFSSSSGDTADLDGLQISEKIVTSQNTFAGAADINLGYGEGGCWPLDETGQMGPVDTWDWHVHYAYLPDGTVTLDVNDYLPDGPWPVTIATQTFAWHCDACDTWVTFGQAITVSTSLIKMAPLPSGVVPFKMLITNVSADHKADKSNEDVPYLKNLDLVNGPQYYVGPAPGVDKSYNLAIDVSSGGWISPGSQLSATMTGMIGATEGEVATASKNVTFHLIDDNPLFDTVLWTFTENVFAPANGGVPAGASAKGSVFVPISVVKPDALNQRMSGTVISHDGATNEGIGDPADISFEIECSGFNPQASPPYPVYSFVYDAFSHDPAPAVYPLHIPLEGSATVLMHGWLEATATTGTMEILLNVIDDDPLFDDILVSNVAHTVQIPQGQILNGLVAFTKTASITNELGIVQGADGSSGEGTASDPADISFEREEFGENPQAVGDTNVTAEQP